MADKIVKSASYDESDAAKANPTSRPILTSGIGRRIGEAARLVGSRTSAYTVMGVSSAALQRYIKEENVPPFDAVAKLCLVTNVRMEWVATGEGDMLVKAQQSAPESASHSASHVVRQETLTIALQLASEALGDKELPVAKHAELVSLIYELLEEGLPEAKVLRFARAAA